MADNQTVVVVGTTETDEYGNLWVTPKGGGDRIKIAAKRSGLHPIFEQGKAIMLKWQTYQEHPYVADAKPVAGELQPEQEPTILPEHEEVIKEAREEATKPAPQEIGMWFKELGNRIGDGSIERDYPNTAVSIKSQYYSKMFKVTGVKPETKGE